MTGRHPLQDAIGEAAQQQHERQLEEDAQRVKDLLIEVQTAAFDKGAAYTNLIMLGGYAGAFTIWNFTRDLMPATAHAWVALTLTVSLASFVLFEIFGMFIRSIAAFEQGRLLTEDLPPKKLLEKMEEMRKRARFRLNRIVQPVWAVANLIAIPAALTAIGICFWHFARASFLALS